PCARNGVFRYFDNWSNGNAIAPTTLGNTATTAVVDNSGNALRPARNPDGTPFTGTLHYASVFGPLPANYVPRTPDCSDAIPQGSPWESHRNSPVSSGHSS